MSDNISKIIIYSRIYAFPKYYVDSIAENKQIFEPFQQFWRKNPDTCISIKHYNLNVGSKEFTLSKVYTCLETLKNNSSSSIQ